jgi:hypothetical protein
MKFCHVFDKKNDFGYTYFVLTEKINYQKVSLLFQMSTIAIAKI